LAPKDQDVSACDPSSRPAHYVAMCRDTGEMAWLFPMVASDQAGATQVWSKCFGRYLRKTVGVVHAATVVHSFRHGFKDWPAQRAFLWKHTTRSWANQAPLREPRGRRLSCQL